MPERRGPGRPPGADAEETREKILDAAFEVFAQRGFAGASNREIARRAGVTPALLYWYFEDKARLFAAAVERRIPVATLLQLSPETLDLPPQEFLPRLGGLLFSAITQPQNLQVFRTVLSEATRFPEVAELAVANLDRLVHGALAGYLRHQMDRGRLRAMDAVVAAQMLQGAFFGFGVFGRMLGAPKLRELSNDAVVGRVVDIFLYGMVPRDRPNHGGGPEGEGGHE